MPIKWNIIDYRLYMSQINVPTNEKNKNYLLNYKYSSTICQFTHGTNHYVYGSKLLAHTITNHSQVATKKKIHYEWSRIYMVNFYNDKLVKQYTAPNTKEPKEIKIIIRSIQQYIYNFLNHKYNLMNVPNIPHKLHDAITTSRLIFNITNTSKKNL